MKRRFSGIPHVLALALSAGLASATVWAADERPRVGGVERLEHEATASYGSETRSLAVEDAVLFQDLLKTGSQGRLAVALADGTALTLGENATLRVDEFVYQPDEGKGKLDVSVFEGAFLFVGGESESQADSQVSIDTAVGTLGVRGTTVWGGRIDGSYGVLVAEGNVTVRNAGGEVELGAGEGTQIVSMDTAPSAPKTWPEAKVQRALQTISFAEN